MRFITITLIVHAPDPFTGARKFSPVASAG
jgi:hypothetical protein